MAKSLRSRRTRKHWILPVIIVILLTAAGTVLYRFPPSLQDIGRIIQSAVGKIPKQSAGQLPADSVLRGTIYDQRFNELAVSYRLFALALNPAELINLQEAAQMLAPIVGKKPEIIVELVKDAQSPVELADNLEEMQAAQIEGAGLKGVSCRPTEARFYPGHTAASHVLGFMGDGVGLTGVEGKYDTVLSPGIFRKNNIPDIDFQGQESLGLSTTDLILTLDLDLQKRLETRFREYLAVHGSEKGMGLVIEPGSGRILALVNQPSFNPNYFWKAKETSRQNRIYNHVLDKELIRPILARAAAIEREGIESPGFLPETVSAPDYGFNTEQLARFQEQIQLFGSVFGNWESGPTVEQGDKVSVVTGVQVGVTLASLVNGGWRITPYVVDSIYDHGTTKRYFRSGEATEKSHVLDPALGVKIRRELFQPWLAEQENLVSFTAERLEMHREKQWSRYSMQELFAGMAPARQPKYLLLMAVERDHLQPMKSDSSKDKGALERMGREMLAAFQKEEHLASSAEKPPVKSKDNRSQFFLSKRLNFHAAPGRVSEPVAAMPSLKGMSLRKGLQRLNQYNLEIRVKGSGKIIAQYPIPGAPLTGVKECMLTLEMK